MSWQRQNCGLTKHTVYLYFALMGELWGNICESTPILLQQSDPVITGSKIKFTHSVVMTKVWHRLWTGKDTLYLTFRGDVSYVVSIVSTMEKTDHAITTQACLCIVAWYCHKPISQWLCSFQIKATLPLAKRLATSSHHPSVNFT